ncbi:hypothetical protein OUZ56_032628 [Daphnia magna]|uniref:Uncharacterized protein n=1 Tax=Daphnia magna TaxID=35525 RepID=A0ABR0B9F9_9CRUS|nr:hypothetical protein OUZ56_032628 [Daphnia magna]
MISRPPFPPNSLGRSTRSRRSPASSPCPRRFRGPRRSVARASRCGSSLSAIWRCFHERKSLRHPPASRPRSRLQRRGEGRRHGGAPDPLTMLGAEEYNGLCKAVTALGRVCPWRSSPSTAPARSPPSSLPRGRRSRRRGRRCRLHDAPDARPLGDLPADHDGDGAGRDRGRAHRVLRGGDARHRFDPLSAGGLSGGPRQRWFRVRSRYAGLRRGPFLRPRPRHRPREIDPSPRRDQRRPRPCDRRAPRKPRGRLRDRHVRRPPSAPAAGPSRRRREPPLGGNLANIFATLSAALGARFLGLRVLTPAEATVVPSSPTAGAGVYASRARPRVALKLVDPIAGSGGAQWVDCVPLSTLEFPDLPQANTKAVLEPDVDGLAETVTILGARRSGSVIQLEIENLRPPGAGAPLVTGPSPLQWSPKRTYLVAIKMALGEERYATQVHEIMRRLHRSGDGARTRPRVVARGFYGARRLELPMTLASARSATDRWQTLTTADLEAWDVALTAAVDADAGGTWTPSAVVSFVSPGSVGGVALPVLQAAAGGAIAFETGSTVAPAKVTFDTGYLQYNPPFDDYRASSAAPANRHASQGCAAHGDYASFRANGARVWFPVRVADGVAPLFVDVVVVIRAAWGVAGTKPDQVPRARVVAVDADGAITVLTPPGVTTGADGDGFVPVTLGASVAAATFRLSLTLLSVIADLSRYTYFVEVMEESGANAWTDPTKAAYVTVGEVIASIYDSRAS